MKLALLSDLHANWQAFDACLAHASGQGFDQLALLGDLVGYGADPSAVVQRVMQLAAEGAIVLMGNHDEMAVQPRAGDLSLGGSTAPWTHLQLSAVQRQFLATLPLTWCGAGVLLAHASAAAPERWTYVNNARSASACLDAALAWPEVRHVFLGHVHAQTLYYRSRMGTLMPFAPTPGVPVPTPGHRHWVATVGSVGQPRDGDPRAMYAVFDTTAARLTFHRVAYDQHGAAAAIRRVGLPAYFAKRLEVGQ